MKTLLFLAITTLSAYTGISQPSTLQGLLDYINLRENRLEWELSKDGYKKSFLYSESGNTAFTYEKNSMKDSSPVYHSYKMLNEDDQTTTLVYETSSLDERNELLNELVAKGFHAPSVTMHGNKIIYQKENISIEPGISNQNHEAYYWFRISKRTLPKAGSMSFAEDLLDFNSQEYLIAAFGKENVKEDVFHFSPTETNRCTVLYPNTNKEAIFVWNDEDNLKDLAFIIIGGSLQKEDDIRGLHQITRNAWLTRQGIFCGMSLQDVTQINKQDIKIFNWNTDAGGYLAPHNRGAIDFKHLGMVFDCWNCSLEKQERQPILSSSYFADDYKKVYVSTLIILPDKKTQSGSISQGNLPY